MTRLLLLVCLLLPLLCDAGNQLVDLYLSRHSPDHLLHKPLVANSNGRAEDHSPHLSAALRDLPLPENFIVYDFEGGNFPNPRTDRATCRTNGANLQGASICDPDSALSNNEMEQLQAKINRTLDGQGCQCSPCTTADKVAGGRYSISIAIPQFLSDNSNATNRPYCATTKLATFGNNLRTGRFSNLAKCDDGIILTLSTADQVYDISVSNRPGKRLSTSCRNTIMEKVRPMMERREYYKSFDDMIDYVNHALNGGKCGDKSGLTSDQVAGIISGVVIGTALIIFLIVACVGFFRNWKCIAATFLGVIIGACLRAVQIVINILIIKCMSIICGKLTDLIPACEEPCGCCQCEPLTCVEDVEAGGGGGGGW